MQNPPCLPALGRPGTAGTAVPAPPEKRKIPSPSPSRAHPRALGTAWDGSRTIAANFISLQSISLHCAKFHFALFDHELKFATPSHLLPSPKKATTPNADTFFPPFYGHQYVSLFHCFSCSGVRSPQVIGSPESCGAGSGCKPIQCIRRSPAAPGPWTNWHFPPALRV